MDGWMREREKHFAAEKERERERRPPQKSSPLKTLATVLRANAETYSGSFQEARVHLLLLLVLRSPSHRAPHPAPAFTFPCCWRTNTVPLSSNLSRAETGRKVARMGGVHVCCVVCGQEERGRV